MVAIYLGVFPITLVITHPLFKGIELDSLDLSVLEILTTGGCLCALYLAGYIGVAIATGHFDLLKWPFSLIEVDVAPPWGECRLQTYAF